MGSCHLRESRIVLRCQSMLNCAKRKDKESSKYLEGRRGFGIQSPHPLCPL